MEVNLGDVAQETFDWKYEGQTFTRVRSFINNVETIWNPVFTDLTGGFYRYTYTTASVGMHEWAGNSSLWGPLTINFEVEPIPTGDGGGVIVSGQDIVSQGGTWIDYTDPIYDLSGAPITGGAGNFTFALFDPSNVNQSAGIGVAHVSGGMYRVSKLIPVNAVLGDWGGIVTYDDGINPVYTQVIEFRVVTPAQEDPLSFLMANHLVVVPFSQAPLAAGQLTIRRGDTVEWVIATNQDLDGATIWFSVKPRYPQLPTDDLADVTAIINASWIDGGASSIKDALGNTIGTISVADPTLGVVVIELNPSFTTTLEETNSWVWEIQLKRDDDTIATIVQGTVAVSKDLIRRTTTP